MVEQWTLKYEQHKQMNRVKLLNEHTIIYLNDTIPRRWNSVASNEHRYHLS